MLYLVFGFRQTQPYAFNKLLYYCKSSHTLIFTDYIEDYNLYTFTNLQNANVQYTYINPNDVTSKINHFFFVTESLRSLTLDCSIINKDLYSDHVLLYLKFYIDAIHVHVPEL